MLLNTQVKRTITRMLSASSEGRRRHRSGAPPAACPRWQEWAGKQLLVRGTRGEENGCWGGRMRGNDLPTWRRTACFLSCWLKGTASPPHACPWLGLGKREGNGGQAPQICWEVCKTWNLTWVFLVWVWELTAGSQSSIAWLEKRKEEREGSRCWWLVWLFSYWQVLSLRRMPLEYLTSSKQELFRLSYN